MIFYTLVRDVKQELAAARLTERNWRWHKLIRQWLQKDTRDTNTANVVDFTNGYASPLLAISSSNKLLTSRQHPCRCGAHANHPQQRARSLHLLQPRALAPRASRIRPPLRRARRPPLHLRAGGLGVEKVVLSEHVDLASKERSRPSGTTTFQPCDTTEKGSSAHHGRDLSAKRQGAVKNGRAPRQRSKW